MPVVGEALQGTPLPQIERATDMEAVDRLANVLYPLQSSNLPRSLTPDIASEAASKALAAIVDLDERTFALKA